MVYVEITIQHCHIMPRRILKLWFNRRKWNKWNHLTWNGPPSEWCGDNMLNYIINLRRIAPRDAKQQSLHASAKCGHLQISFAKCKRMAPRMSGMYAVPTQIWELHREKQSVWNFSITWQFHWLSPPWSADSAVSNNGLTYQPRKFLRADWTPIRQHGKYYAYQRKITQK